LVAFRRRDGGNGIAPSLVDPTSPHAITKPVPAQPHHDGTRLISSPRKMAEMTLDEKVPAAVTEPQAAVTAERR
jgi:hypothetical protein